MTPAPRSRWCPLPYKSNEDRTRCKNRSYHKRYATPEGRIRILINEARRRAKRINQEFEEEIRDELQFIPAKCPLKETELSLEGGRDNSPSIDRIDSSKGYVRGNVWFISDRANRLKGNGSLEEWELIIKNWRAHVDSKKV